MKNKKVIAFLAAFLTVVVGVHVLLCAVLPAWFIQSDSFYLNDYEVTKRKHPEEVYDKVFYGSSVVINAYREKYSQSGYINAGMVYGTVRDLVTMLRKGWLKIGSELVLGANYLLFYDDLDQDPTYPWYMEWYTPRAYFYRDRLSQKLLFWEEGDPPRLSKSYVHGTMTDEELAEKTSSERYISFGTQPDSAYDDNFQALQELYDYCQTNGIRLRVVWMPTNPRVEPMPSGVAVQARLKQACEDLGVEYVDLSNMLPADCFYDTGHINQDGGSQQFTEVIDPWLNS